MGVVWLCFTILLFLSVLFEGNYILYDTVTGGRRKSSKCNYWHGNYEHSIKLFLLNETVKQFFKKIYNTGEDNSYQYLQQVSVAVQRGNAAAVLGTCPSGAS